MTSVGRCTCSMSHAVVADLPVPVAPSSTTSFSPAFTFSASCLIAAGWSPEGSKSLTTRKRPWVGRMSVVVLTGRRYDGGVTGRVRAVPAPTGAPGEIRTPPLLVLDGGAPLACLVAERFQTGYQRHPRSPRARSDPGRRGPVPTGAVHRGRPAPVPPAPAPRRSGARRPPRPGPARGASSYPAARCGSHTGATGTASGLTPK